METNLFTSSTNAICPHYLDNFGFFPQNIREDLKINIYQLSMSQPTMAYVGPQPPRLL